MWCEIDADEQKQKNEQWLWDVKSYKPVISMII